MGRVSGLPEGRVDTRNCTDARGIYNSYFVTYSCKYVTTDISPNVEQLQGRKNCLPLPLLELGVQRGLQGYQVGSQPTRGP